ncbi:hypothetical protein QFC21_006493 [Naganishia friedmannii]|uniref:Uncharacterized protein n=1 Tax=Naganishia friedmannii TaxID=89922 RepID=A0ACC2V3F3_9TREE|nr:hypothetical protein QFC21_006493 [Naganishia friedmannii]
MPDITSGSQPSTSPSQAVSRADPLRHAGKVLFDEASKVIVKTAHRAHSEAEQPGCVFSLLFIDPIKSHSLRHRCRQWMLRRLKHHTGFTSEATLSHVASRTPTSTRRHHVRMSEYKAFRD